MVEFTEMMNGISKFCDEKSNSIENESRLICSKDKALNSAMKSLQRLLDLTGSIIYKSTI